MDGYQGIWKQVTEVVQLHELEGNTNIADTQRDGLQRAVDYGHADAMSWQSTDPHVMVLNSKMLNSKFDGFFGSARHINLTHTRADFHQLAYNWIKREWDRTELSWLGEYNHDHSTNFTSEQVALMCEDTLHLQDEVFLGMIDFMVGRVIVPYPYAQQTAGLELEFHQYMDMNNASETVAQICDYLGDDVKVPQAQLADNLRRFLGTIHLPEELQGKKNWMLNTKSGDPAASYGPVVDLL